MTRPGCRFIVRDIPELPWVLWEMRTKPNARRSGSPDSDSLKQRSKAGELVVGVSAPLDSDRSSLEGILSKDNYSFLTLDSQHSPYNEEKLVAFLL